MGYDRTIAVFSPEGRLLQVEYAKESVKRGTTALGIVFRDGVLLATIKPNIPLMISTSAEKTFQIDDHIGVVAAGLLADARALVNLARVRAQIHRITYEEQMDVWGLAHVIGDRMQLSTLYAGLRPYGVAFLIGGVDTTGVHLLEADPSGMLYEWFAHAIGRGAGLVNKILQQKWKPNMSEKDAVHLAIDTLLKGEKEKSKENIEIAIIKKGERFKKLSSGEIKSL